MPVRSEGSEGIWLYCLLGTSEIYDTFKCHLKTSAVDFLKTIKSI